MRFPIWVTVIAAVVTMGIIVLIGRLVLQPERALVANVGFSPSTISPNADGIDDITEFVYTLNENAYVSLKFITDGGTEYSFRERERRSEGEYRVLFSGVVEGFSLPDDDIQGEIVRRLIPNGDYTWEFRVEAQESDEVVIETGTLRVEGGDTPLPDIIEFSVGPDNFTPNQDGVNDRVIINVFLQKDSELDVYLLNEIEQRIPVPRREEGQNAGESGRHVFDYDGGIDNGVDPPVDGTYLLVADAQDDEGQIIRRSTPLTIRDGGLPRAEIVAQPVGPTVVFDFMPYDEKYFSYLDDEMQLVLGEFIAPPDDSDSLSLDPITMPLGDMLVFKLTIENYGTAPIRTTGPPPGTVYQQDQTVSSLGQYDRSGAWRVGIECETSLSPYPWRWAIGTDDNLYTEEDPTNDNVYSYLAPGERSVVWGAVRMTQLVGTLNPQDCWAGLIHEDVGISIQNSQVGRRPIRLAEMSPATDNG